VLLVVVASTSCSRCGARAVPDAGAGPDRAWLEGRPTPELGLVSRTGGTLTLRAAVEPTGFSRIDDRFAEGTMARYTTGTIYETLARVDPSKPDGALLPWLARSWALTDRSLTLELLHDVGFHDGSAFDAADVRATVAAVLEAKNPTVGLRAALGPISEVVVETPDRVVVRYSRGPSPFEVRALLGGVPAMPSEALAGPYDVAPIHQHPIGTGPFRFVRFTPGDRLILERVANHRAPALVDAIHVRFVKDDTIAAQLWEKGEFDLMTRIPPAHWRAIEHEPWAWKNYRRFRIDENAYAWIGWNLKRPVFADVRVRRALAMLYPAEVISKAVELGLERRTTCPFWIDSDSCDPEVRPIPFDPARAKALLDEAGWKDADGDGVREQGGVRLEFAFLMPTTSARLGKVLPLFQEQLKNAGVSMTMEPVDGAQLMSRMRAHDFDAAALSWSSPDALSDQWEIFHSSQAEGGKNYVQYAGADELLDRIRTASEPAERKRLERELHRRLFADQPYLFLTARPALDAVKNRVHGLTPSLAWYELAKGWVDP